MTRDDFLVDLIYDQPSDLYFSARLGVEGNYQDYEADRKRRLGIAADQPHRIKYKPLTRN
jgi:hypothetical protein